MERGEWREGNGERGMERGEWREGNGVLIEIDCRKADVSNVRRRVLGAWNSLICS
jgi:hypothetical protein